MNPSFSSTSIFLMWYTVSCRLTSLISTLEVLLLVLLMILIILVLFPVAGFLEATFCGPRDRVSTDEVEADFLVGSAFVLGGSSSFFLA